MSWKTFRGVAVVATALTLVATACAPATPGGGAGASAAPSGAAASAGAAPAKGGTLTFAIWQEPNTLHPFYGTQTVVGVVLDTVIEPLLDVDTNGDFQPRLAKEVPTVQNGGVKLSGDGKSMDVTYKLRDGVKWSDGQPFTSADVKFTWEQVMKDPKVTSREGYEKITAIDTPDPLTAVVHYKEIYGPYATRFASVMPKHLLEKVEDVSKSDYVRKPLGTGPFMVTDFKAAEAITVERNPNYWQKDKPLLDRIIFRSVPSREVAVAQLKAGEVQGMWNLLEAQIPDLEKDPEIKLVVTPGPSVERLEFNLAKPGDPADPSVPHPVLSDLAVRRALLLATPKQQLIDKLLFGKAKAGTSPVSQGWAASKDVTQEGYDPNKAKQVLDAAGWKPGADGIREKSGVKAALTITTTTGDKVREQVEQILVDEYKNIGVKLEIKNVPSSVLFGSWSQNAPRKKGNFDINMYASSPDVDPHSSVAQRLHSRNIPTPANNGAGFNYNRFSDPDVDKLIDDAGNSVDQAKRKELYKKVMQAVNEKVLNVWLYDRSGIDAFRTNVSGYAGNTWENITASAASWAIKK